MRDHTSANTATSNAPLVIYGHDVQDLSFEAQNVPRIFQETRIFQEIRASPTVSIHVDMDSHELQENTFEFTLGCHIRSEIEDKVAFILELVYAAVVSVNVPHEHVQPLVMGAAAPVSIYTL